MIFKRIRAYRDKRQKDFVNCKHDYKIIKLEYEYSWLLGLLFSSSGEDLVLVCKKCGDIIPNIEV